MKAPPSSPIERIDPDPRIEGAVRLIIDGRTALTVPIEAVRAEGVSAGGFLGAEAFERLCAAADLAAAYRTALRLLERRPFARRDLGRRLRLKGHLPAAVEPALERAERAGLLDDERFARHFVQTRTARGRGPARIRRELMIQGVPDDVIGRVVAEEVSEDASRSAVATLARKRAHQLRDLDRDDRIRRVVAYLARRGYTGMEVRRVVRQVSDESLPAGET